ncbi:reverse transcriptase [Tanacetum coccineum]
MLDMSLRFYQTLQQFVASISAQLNDFRKFVASGSTMNAPSVATGLDSTSYLRYVLGSPCYAISLLHADIIVIHYACSLTFNRGWFNATVESDSQLAISLSSSKTPSPLSLATFVDDIRMWANNMQLSFSWVNRENNQVAQWVAHHTFSTTSWFGWDVSFPQKLTSLARSDLYGS